MRLLCVTDIHSEVRRFEKILSNEPQADVLIIGGDFTDFGKPPEVSRMLDIAQAHTPKVLAVAGNCDSPEIDQLLLERGVSLHARGVRIGDIGFFGVSAMPPWRGNMYEFPEEELDRFLAAGYAQVEGSPKLIMVPHAPPRNSGVDRTILFMSVGSTAIRSWVEKVNPVLVICGHIHEARGQGKIGNTIVVNCGPARNGNYATAEVGNEIKVALKKI
ncbi:MAG: metallophosphoesterase family protein [candidate division KSB1 bacterium]|nr:metallophosphoesterase family protein [candidate division KSB1 bacterium]MDZ7301717.1 metallophosphoesterase family protein [candidate division KSB1 bacterium]MDZ7312396.1 metallophosphoesterase family protein [candidate division KSB1 bacterium]